MHRANVRGLSGWPWIPALVLVLAVSPASARVPACARGGGASSIGTLAYVVTECRFDTQGLYSGRQRLVVRRGECPPITVIEIASGPPVADENALCLRYGESRFGSTSIVVGAIHRLAVSPRGDAVVFEMTRRTAVPLLPPVSLPLPEGLYYVRADGTGLRRLGDASRVADYAIVEVDTSFRVFTDVLVDLYFSPDGRRIAYTDLGPGADGVDAPQVFVMHLARTPQVTQVTQVTQRTARGVTPLSRLETRAGAFLDHRTLAYSTFDPASGESVSTTHVDGSGTRRLPDPVVQEGARVVSRFAVTGQRTRLLTFELLDPPPINPFGPFARTREAFAFDGKKLLQLTAFHRADTEDRVRIGQRAFFTASADPLGTNPDNTCQLFSIDLLAGGLRQLTGFRGSLAGHEFGAAREACRFGAPECYVNPVFADPRRRTLVFMSSCSSGTARPYGAQIYAMRDDGSAMRQLTDVEGAVVESDGTLRVELPGPVAYAGGAE